MPETPDFNAIAQRLVWSCDPMNNPHAPDDVPATIGEQLRQVWNARGAADLAKLEEVDGYRSEMYVAELKKLDR